MRPSIGHPRGLQAVQNHVEHHLLQLRAIAAHRRQVFGEIEAHRHVPEDRVIADEVCDFTDHLIDVERDIFERALLQHGP